MLSSAGRLALATKPIEAEVHLACQTQKALMAAVLSRSVNKVLKGATGCIVPFP
jgi:hypothetical protein